jgi:hypothetical protein
LALQAELKVLDCGTIGIVVVIVVSVVGGPEGKIVAKELHYEGRVFV